MSDIFAALCSEALRSTRLMYSHEECYPHYQPVLDYILSHSDERDDVAVMLSEFVATGGYTEIALIKFLMTSLKWPEIRTAAEERCAKEGNMYWEIKHLIDVYEPVSQKDKHEPEEPENLA